MEKIHEIKIEKFDSRFEEIAETELTPEDECRLKEVIDAITSVESLIEQNNFFIPGERFFKTNDGKIEYVKSEISASIGKIKLLHEYGHLVLGHMGDIADSAAVRNERLAWIFAVKAMEKLGFELDDSVKEVVAESYRSYERYVENKRVCPSCGSDNSKEFAAQKYTCPHCYNDW